MSPISDGFGAAEFAGEFTGDEPVSGFSGVGTGEDPYSGEGEGISGALDGDPETGGELTGEGESLPISGAGAGEISDESTETVNSTKLITKTEIRKMLANLAIAKGCIHSADKLNRTSAANVDI